MAFDVAADSYARFMGRFSEPLAEAFMDFAAVASGHRALDVGCGPGALTSRLVERLGASAVCAVEPSAPFLAAARERLPEVDIRSGTAEALPFEEDSFDLALAQLVVHFMTDPVAGLAEMRRVTRPGGTVAASVWDHATGRGPLSMFWDVVHDLDAVAADESELPGAREGDLAELGRAAGLADVDSDALTVTVRYSSFEEWWDPFTLGVGPAGDYVGRLDDDRRAVLKDRLEARAGEAPLEISATAWCMRGRA
jgi:SAM-dependent methyltransferase